MSEQEFLHELQELLKKYPEVAKKFLVHSEDTTEQLKVARGESEARGGSIWSMVCIEDPQTREVKCYPSGTVASADHSQARAAGAPRAASRARPRRGKPKTRDTEDNKT